LTQDWRWEIKNQTREDPR